MLNRLYLSILGVLLAAGPAAAQRLQIGDPAPPLAISKWVKGEAIELGKGDPAPVVLVEFWATWCPPCIQSIPHLTELQKKHKDRGLVVIGVSDEPPAVVRKFSRQWGERMNYTVACDDNRKTNAAYMVASGQPGIPTAFIIDRDNKIAWIGSPFDNLDAVLEAVIAGTYDVAQAAAEAKADDEFARTRQIALLMSMQVGDWAETIKIAKELVAPRKPISKTLRTRILDDVAWILLTDERAGKKYVNDAVELSRAARDISDGKNFSVLDTYALALFESGDTEAAVRNARLALELVADPSLRAQIRARLARYEGEKP